MSRLNAFNSKEISNNLKEAKNDFEQWEAWVAWRAWEAWVAWRANDGDER